LYQYLHFTGDEYLAQITPSDFKPSSFTKQLPTLILITSYNTTETHAKYIKKMQFAVCIYADRKLIVEMFTMTASVITH